VTDEKRQWTQAELLEEAQKRFGPEPRFWKFECPTCFDVSCAQDWLDLGLDPKHLGQDCIGRFLGALKKPKPTNERGCDWCAYGLFSGPWTVILPKPEGVTREVGSFRLATADYLTLPDGKQYAGTLRRDEMGKPIVELAECGVCHFVWNDALGTEVTPAPAARCPNEYGH
jgi:hypothetical protein